MLHSPTGASPKGSPLCPSCGSRIVKIGASIQVDYHVYYADSAMDLAVIAEELGDGEWGEDSPAACTACDWTGAVRDLACK